MRIILEVQSIRDQALQ